MGPRHQGLLPRMPGQPGQVELQSGQGAAHVVVQLARHRGALGFHAGLQVPGQRLQLANERGGRGAVAAPLPAGAIAVTGNLFR